MLPHLSIWMGTKSLLLTSRTLENPFDKSKSSWTQFVALCPERKSVKIKQKKSLPKVFGKFDPKQFEAVWFSEFWSRLTDQARGGQ